MNHLNSKILKRQKCMKTMRFPIEPSTLITKIKQSEKNLSNEKCLEKKSEIKLVD